MYLSVNIIQKVLRVKSKLRYLQLTRVIFQVRILFTFVYVLISFLLLRYILQSTARRLSHAPSLHFPRNEKKKIKKKRVFPIGNVFERILQPRTCQFMLKNERIILSGFFIIVEQVTSQLLYLRINLHEMRSYF